MHPNACFMAKGAMAAAKQGNYWEMSSLLYENQPKNVEDMVKLAEKLDFDKDTFLKDFQSPETAKELDNEINDANSLGIDSTPTMFINGKSTVGVMTYSELRDLLIQNGAKHK